ncbi:MAG: uracil-DNA glycosylase family protein, partial [Bacteroidaceae bacterium]|nr:uracil-DNA glycosylase family protein [Bacteroidaceae bacterium]
IALYDTACEVRRLKDNASDKFLEVVTPTDLSALLRQMPQCRAIVTTGQKATDVIVETFGCKKPAIGDMEPITLADGRCLHFWRMPSSSRAYPLALEKKADYYHKMFINELNCVS